jgi:hypothetical protein
VGAVTEGNLLYYGDNLDVLRRHPLSVVTWINPPAVPTEASLTNSENEVSHGA